MIHLLVIGLTLFVAYILLRFITKPAKDAQILEPRLWVIQIFLYLIIVLVLAFWIGGVYMIGHFVIKYW